MVDRNAMMQLALAQAQWLKRNEEERQKRQNKIDSLGKNSQMWGLIPQGIGLGMQAMSMMGGMGGGEGGGMGGMPSMPSMPQIGADPQNSSILDQTSPSQWEMRGMNDWTGGNPMLNPWRYNGS